MYGKITAAKDRPAEVVQPGSGGGAPAMVNELPEHDGPIFPKNIFLGRRPKP
jgi:hypothetical protein